MNIKPTSIFRARVIEAIVSNPKTLAKAIEQNKLPHYGKSLRKAYFSDAYYYNYIDNNRKLILEAEKKAKHIDIDEVVCSKGDEYEDTFMGAASFTRLVRPFDYPVTEKERSNAICDLTDWVINKNQKFSRRTGILGRIMQLAE